MQMQESTFLEQNRPEPDPVLAAKAQAGDLNAEEELLRRHKKLARSKANMYYVVGADEDDVMQEAMIGLLKAVRQYDPEKDASFQTFAGICVTNQIISAIRAAERNKHKALNTSVSLNASLARENSRETEQEGVRLEDTLMASTAYSPEQILVFKDITECILHNNDKVFSDYEMKAVTGLMRGCSKEEIALDLGRTVKSVDNCLQRAKRKIITYLFT